MRATAPRTERRLVRVRTSLSRIGAAEFLEDIDVPPLQKPRGEIGSAALSSGLGRDQNPLELTVLIRHKTYA